MSLASYRATRTEYTMAERRALGHTIMTDGIGGPVELVHGKQLARELLAEYDALNDESDHVWRTISPFRSDLALIEAEIQEDYIEIGERLAYAINKWLDDCEQEVKNRDRAICRVADQAMYD